MFNKTLVVAQGRDRTVHVPYEKTVNHNYATTSEQAKHLEDLQKQAWEMVTDVLVGQIDDNLISNIAVRQQHDMYHFKELTHAVFTLNGKKIDVDIALDEFNEPSSTYEYFNRLAEGLAAEITGRLMQEIMSRRPKHY